MKKLWQKNYQMDALIESFETKGDLLLDQKLALYDNYGSLAHAKMLNKIGVLTDKEMKSITAGLREIFDLLKLNDFNLQPGDEDIHTKIENFLTENYGDAGKKINTGRSRNDQVLVAIRLFTKVKMFFIWKDLLTLIGSFQSFAKKYEYVPMPGYTHTQKAMPSSVGMWAGAMTEALIDDLIGLKAAYELNNRSPLGSAAGYGVPLPIDREYTCNLLGFENLQTNSLYCQNSRGKIEAGVMASLNSILLDINKFATDIVWFTTSEFSYFDVDKKLCTGSSIMPQKKNVDVAELLRSKIHVSLGNYSQVISLSSNLISGYNRDLQDSKKPLMESLEITEDSINAANLLINNITPNKEKLKKSLTPEIYATHKALALVAEGVPFREAYQAVGEDISDITESEIDTLKQSTHIGGTGNLGLKKYAARLKKEKMLYNKEYKKYKTAISNLVRNV